MCFDISYALKKDEIERRFEARLENPEMYKPAYHVSAFSIPNVPVITNEKIDTVQLLSWGLIPFWVKDEKNADEIRMKTFNARAETIFEKASFRSSIRKKRCLVVVDGFYEWRLVNGKNYPYYIYMKDQEPFALAGIWDSWRNRETEDIRNTFSIITTRANPLLEKIHNKKKRMPVILGREGEKHWLAEKVGREDIVSMMEPYDDREMDAHTVSRLVSFKRDNTNVPEVLKKYEYEELKSQQSRLF